MKDQSLDEISPAILSDMSEAKARRIRNLRAKIQDYTAKLEQADKSESQKAQWMATKKELERQFQNELEVRSCVSVVENIRATVVVYPWLCLGNEILYFAGYRSG